MFSFQERKVPSNQSRGISLMIMKLLIPITNSRIVIINNRLVKPNLQLQNSAPMILPLSNLDSV